jgi:stalled ribosome rescue protein Dom34
MLMASQKAKKGFENANVPRAENINAMLAANFTEYELQTMYSDLRFFFPNTDRTYNKLSIFHDLDIFEGEHFRIKQAYFEKVERQRLKKLHKIASKNKTSSVRLEDVDSYNERLSED